MFTGDAVTELTVMEMTGFRHNRSQLLALNYQKQGGCNYQTEQQEWNSSQEDCPIKNNEWLTKHSARRGKIDGHLTEVLVKIHNF